MSNQLHLYFIACKDDGNGENLDQFVIASSEEQALGFWRDGFELDETFKPDRVNIVPGVMPMPTRAAGVLGWDEINPED